jgi:hypothetical protein
MPPEALKRVAALVRETLENMALDELRASFAASRPNKGIQIVSCLWVLPGRRSGMPGRDAIEKEPLSVVRGVEVSDIQISIFWQIARHRRKARTGGTASGNIDSYSESARVPSVAPLVW